MAASALATNCIRKVSFGSSLPSPIIGNAARSNTTYPCVTQYIGDPQLGAINRFGLLVFWAALDLSLYSLG